MPLHHHAWPHVSTVSGSREPAASRRWPAAHTNTEKSARSKPSCRVSYQVLARDRRTTNVACMRVADDHPPASPRLSVPRASLGRGTTSSGACVRRCADEPRHGDCDKTGPQQLSNTCDAHECHGQGWEGGWARVVHLLGTSVVDDVCMSTPVSHLERLSADSYRRKTRASSTDM